jgi:hypothetical protein
VALALDFATSRDARTFVAKFAAIARSCPAPPTTSADQPLTTVILPVRVSGVTVLDRRRELGRGAGPYVWSEAVVEQGRRVGLLIVASSIGAARPDLRDLAARLRHSVSR